jgi:ribosomal protein S12 methylthiotransferase accessory factor
LSKSQLDSAVDFRTGIIRSYRAIPPFQRYPRLWIAFAKSCDATKLGALSEFQSGGGIGRTFEEAKSAALGEALERYCASFPPSALIHCQWSTLRERGFDLNFSIFNNLHSYAADGFYEMTENGFARWCTGWRAAKKQKSFAPWSLVCLGASKETRDLLDECYPGPSISTGLACAPSTASASLKAILECCERDACMISWYTRKFRGKITDELLSHLWPFLASELRRCGLRAHIIDVTNDLKVPSFISVITPINCYDKAAFGMASGLSWTAAAGRALMESIQTWCWADTSRRQAEPITAKNVGIDFPDFESRVVAYGSGLMENELEEFFDAVTRLPIIDAPRDSKEHYFQTTESLSRAFEKKGHPIVLFDVTTEDVRECGFIVQRAICPTLQSMDAVHEYRIPNKHRLAQISATAKYINVPHPFP